MHIRLVCLLSALVLSALVLVGCAPVTAVPDIDPDLAAKEAKIQRKMHVQRKLDRLYRLTDVSLPILDHGVPLCGDSVSYYVGMDTYSVDAVSGEFREEYIEVLDLEERVKIVRVFENTPAHEGGLLAGDVILMMNGKKVETGKGSYDLFFAEFRTLVREGKTLELWIERKGQQQMVTIEPRKLCDYPVLIMEESLVNAYADGETIQVTVGMMNYVESDEELALVVGHELAHNVMGHMAKKNGNRALGAVVDILLAGLTGYSSNTFANLAGMAYSTDFEHEADYVGLYFMERAGYDGSDVAGFWRRMGADNPYAIMHETTHPTSAKRYLMLEDSYQEIALKRKKGEELLPDYKE